VVAIEMDKVGHSGAGLRVEWIRVCAYLGLKSE
jgi:hypothetical protein